MSPLTWKTIIKIKEHSYGEHFYGCPGSNVGKSQTKTTEDMELIILRSS